jgi:glycosyltransferase involved in cell wall biosynthesis/SAM-dependent methyltransferase/GT2 family glycosyltransferase
MGVRITEGPDGRTTPRRRAAVLVPVLNEARLLEPALARIGEQELEGELEILVIDGGSTDGSPDIVARAAQRDDRIRLLDNPAGRTPNALNIGLRAARGAYVARMDAHTYYPRDYIARGIERLEHGDVACASGPQLALGDQATSRAVALALQSPLGVGGARFRRAGGREEDVDSSFCGVWRRDLLLELGGWDEDWPVNQDAELAARIRERGGRIVSLPEMAAQYVPRSSLRALARQYWRYGRYRVKTAGRHPGGLRRSHVLPPGLVGIVASSALPTQRVRPLRWALALYGTVLFAEGQRVARRHSSGDLGVRVTAALATMHVFWGAGFLEGCRRFGVPWRALSGLGRKAPRRSPSATRDLRIGYVVSRFPVLSETFVLRELVEIDGRPGVHGELFSLFPEAGGPAHPAARHWVTRRRRASPPGAARALAYWAAHRPLRLTAVISVVVHDYLSRPRLLGRALVAVASALQHARTLRSEPVDHLHAHFATYPALAAWTCSRLVGIPYSFTAHAHDIFIHRLGLRRRIEDAAFCIGISEYNARILRDLAVRRSADIHVVHCGVQPELYAARPRAPRPGEPMRIACVAAMKAYKGHRVLLDAVGRLARDGQAIEVDLVGDGPLRQELERQCARLGIADRVHFLGGLTEPEVAEVMDRADAFVLASLVQQDGDTDGIPVALMEAMAAGVPVVASDVSGVPELVRDGETGLLAPPEDDAALADALRSVLADPVSATERARTGRALVEERFTVEGEASRLLDLIRGCAPSARSDGGERLAREAAFHDHAFAERTRKKAWKFYDVGRDAYDRYDELLTIMATPGSTVLEYGCGPAGRAFDLARGGAVVHGVDISPVAIGVARETAKRQGVEENTTFSVMDAEALDLPARSFDVVCGTSIIHHLDIDRAYREVARVLRPSGRAVFLEPLGHNPVIHAYRRLTPGLRTADEHPLRLADVNAARAYFGDLTLEHFTLLSLAAVAAHGRPSFERATGVLRRIDRELFTTVPSLRRWSWTIVMVMCQPRAG